MGGTGLEVEGLNGEKRIGIIFVSLLSHHVTESAKHKLAIGFIKKQDIYIKVEVVTFHYTDFLNYYYIKQLELCKMTGKDTHKI